jgi:hypothetical protein
MCQISKRIRLEAGEPDGHSAGGGEAQSAPASLGYRPCFVLPADSAASARTVTLGTNHHPRREPSPSAQTVTLGTNCHPQHEPSLTAYPSVTGHTVTVRAEAAELAGSTKQGLCPSEAGELRASPPPAECPAGSPASTLTLLLSRHIFCFLFGLPLFSLGFGSLVAAASPAPTWMGPATVRNRFYPVRIPFTLGHIFLSHPWHYTLGRCTLCLLRCRAVVEGKTLRPALLSHAEPERDCPGRCAPYRARALPGLALQLSVNAPASPPLRTQ